MRDSIILWCRPRQAGDEQQSTGLLHLDGFESPSEANKKSHPNGWLFCWQRMRDSNPRERSQSPVCYRYTNPLSATVVLYPIILKCQEIFFKIPINALSENISCRGSPCLSLCGEYYLLETTAPRLPICPLGKSHRLKKSDYPNRRGRCPHRPSGIIGRQRKSSAKPEPFTGADVGIGPYEGVFRQSAFCPWGKSQRVKKSDYPNRRGRCLHRPSGIIGRQRKSSAKPEPFTGADVGIGPYEGVFRQSAFCPLGKSHRFTLCGNFFIGDNSPSIADLPFGQIVRNCRRPAGGKRQSPGLSHLDGFESCCSTIKKHRAPFGCPVFFGGDNRTRTCDLMRVKHAL